MLANGREVNVYREAALWPNEQAEHFSIPDGVKRAEAAREDFETERAAYLRAVQLRLSVGRFRRWRERRRDRRETDAPSTIE